MRPNTMQMNDELSDWRNALDPGKPDLSEKNSMTHSWWRTLSNMIKEDRKNKMKLIFVE